MPVIEGFWKNRVTLVTGGTGFIGSHVVRRLHALGARVICLSRGIVRPDDGWSGSPPTMVHADVRDSSRFRGLLEEHEVNTVIHLAGLAIVGQATQNPVEAFEVNVRGTWTVLEACRQVPSVQQLVTASSDKAYGDAKTLPYVEETPLLGRHPYDTSKSCADMIARAYANTYGLRVATTRCGNFFGENDPNDNRVVPGTIRSLLRGERPVIRSDGKFVRDFLYAEDGVDAYLTLAQRLAEDPSLAGEAFNFSAEEPLSVLELVQLIQRLMGSDLSPVVLNQASHELRAQHLSAQKARECLGWTARHSVEQGLRRTIEWYRRQRVVAAPARTSPRAAVASVSPSA